VKECSALLKTIAFSGAVFVLVLVVVVVEVVVEGLVLVSVLGFVFVLVLVLGLVLVFVVEVVVEVEGLVLVVVEVVVAFVSTTLLENLYVVGVEEVTPLMVGIKVMDSGSSNSTLLRVNLMTIFKGWLATRG
jgi:hypothetical protein